MQDFNGKLAVVTGGGTGMGRELVCQLVKEGAHVAMCDVSAENMQETLQLAAPGPDQRVGRTWVSMVARSTNPCRRRLRAEAPPTAAVAKPRSQPSSAAFSTR